MDHEIDVAPRIDRSDGIGGFVIRPLRVAYHGETVARPPAHRLLDSLHVGLIDVTLPAHPRVVRVVFDQVAGSEAKAAQHRGEDK